MPLTRTGTRSPDQADKRPETTDHKVDALHRPDQVALVFGRKTIRKGRHPTPGRFRTRIITDGVTPSLRVSYKDNRIKQYHKLDRAPRAETTINDTRTSASANGCIICPALYYSPPITE